MASSADRSPTKIDVVALFAASGAGNGGCAGFAVMVDAFGSAATSASAAAWKSSCSASAYGFCGALVLIFRTPRG